MSLVTRVKHAGLAGQIYMSFRLVFNSMNTKSEARKRHYCRKPRLSGTTQADCSTAAFHRSTIQNDHCARSVWDTLVGLDSVRCSHISLHIVADESFME